MTHLDADLTVEDLERMKLRRELAELDKKLYQKPAFYAVVGPTLLATLTLGTGLITGQIDLQKENVQAETNRLQNEAILLKINEEKLSQKTKKARDDLAVAQRELTAGKKQVEQTLAIERERMRSRLAAERVTFNEELAAAKTDHGRATKALRDEFEAEREELFDQRSALESQLSEVAGRVAEKTAELTMLKEQLADAKVHALIEQIKLDDNLTAHNSALNSLISSVRERNGIRAIVKQYAESEKDVRVRSHLLYALYLVSGDDNDFSVLAGLIRQHEADPEVWDVVAYGYWSMDDELRLLEFLLDAERRNSFSDQAFAESAGFFYLPENNFSTFNTLLRSKRAYPLVEHALKLVIEGKVSPVSQFYLLLIIAYYDPHLYVVMLAEKIGSGMLDPGVENQFRTEAQDIRQVDFDELAFLAKAMSDSGWPENLRDFDFGGWLRNEDIAPLREAIKKRDYSAYLSRTLPTAP